MIFTNNRAGLFWLFFFLFPVLIGRTVEGFVLHPSTSTFIIKDNNDDDAVGTSRPIYTNRYNGDDRDKASLTRSTRRRHRVGLLWQNPPSSSSETTTEAAAAAAKASEAPEDENERQEQLSDVDARVLQSMLQEKDKLDLNTEDDIRKLLERGTVKKTPTKPKKEVKDNDSPFSSQLFQTLSDTKLWKKLQLQAEETWESVGIWVANKVEQDTKTLAALGIFAWDRAVRDVARALPAAATIITEQRSNPIILALTNSSSYVEQQPASSSSSSNSIRDQLNRPQDEIQTVTREIRDILSGDYRTNNVKSSSSSSSTFNNRIRRNNRSSSSSSGLRTAAPAGIANNAERQRRAYRQRTKKTKQQRDVTKIGGAVIDTAWELKQELKAEANVPGYKSKPVINALEAGVAATGNVLKAAREEARLAAAKRKELRLQQAKEEEPTTSSYDGGVDDTATMTPNYSSTETTLEEITEVDFRPAAAPKDNEDVYSTVQETYYAATPIVQEKEDVDEQPVDASVMDHYAAAYAAYSSQEQQQQQAPTSAAASAEAEAAQADNSATTVQPHMNNEQEIAWLEQLDTERKRIQSVLTKMMDDPSSTWLSPKLMDSFNGTDGIYTAGQRVEDVVTAMIVLQEEIEMQSSGNVEAAVSLEVALGQLLLVRESMDKIIALAAEEISVDVAEQIRLQLYVVGKKNEAKQEPPLVARLEEVAAFLASEDASSDVSPTDDEFIASVEDEEFRVVTAEVALDDDDNVGRERATAVESVKVVDVLPAEVYVDVVPETATPTSFVNTDVDSQQRSSNKDVGASGARSRVFSAEVISDDDFESAMGQAKVAVEASDHVDEKTKEEDSILAQAILRSLDVIFFLLEKVALVGIPTTIVLAKTALMRYDEVQREGKGNEGWKQFKNLADAKGRY